MAGPLLNQTTMSSRQNLYDLGKNTMSPYSEEASKPPSNYIFRKTDADARTPRLSRRTSVSVVEIPGTPSQEEQDERRRSGSIVEKPHRDVERQNARIQLSIRQRLHHFTWAWYTLTMSTAGYSTVLALQPHKFQGLDIIGSIFYVLNLIFFGLITLTMIARFGLYQGDLRNSLYHEREGLFFPTFWLSLSTIISSTYRYVIASEATLEKKEIMLHGVAAIFWCYLACTLILAIVQYSFLFASHTYQLQKMMPSWLLPIFPVMLAGTIASTICQDMDMDLPTKLPILVAGLSAQGLGFIVSIFMYAHMIGRLMQAGLPCREHRPGLFICVGPPSFTALALIGMANALPDDFTMFGDPLIGKGAFRLVALLSAIFLWSLAFWWFFIAALAVIRAPPKYFHLGWWAMVFPNTGFTIATIAIGNELNNESIKWFAGGMTIALGMMWLFVLVSQGLAVYRSDIMYPGRDEDVDD